MTNSRGQAIALNYDGAERLHQVVGQAGITYEYNNDDSLYRVIDGAGTTTITYLPNGLVQTVVYDYNASGLTAIQQLDYTYHPDGSRASLTWRSGGAIVGSWNYSYDPGGRLVGVTNSFGESASWTMDGEGKLLSQVNGNGTRAEYQYNQARGWPTRITHKQGANVFERYDPGLRPRPEHGGESHRGGRAGYLHRSVLL